MVIFFKILWHLQMPFSGIKHFSVLISGWFTTNFYYLRNNFPQVTDVLCTLLDSDSFPKLLNTIYKFFLSPWLNFSSYVFFKFMPEVLNRVKIRRLSNGLPPIDTFLIKKFPSQPRAVLGIIILQGRRY